MTWREIRASTEDGVATITLARPARLNAYTPDMGEELVAALRAALRADDVSAIILTGEGRGFCAGADRDFVDGRQGRLGFRLGEEYFLQGFAEELARAEKPLIAAINGAAIGIGVTMTLPFDVRIASHDAYFGFPFVKLGVVPGMGSTHLLPRLVGHGAARWLMLGSVTLKAEEALRFSLVNEVVEPDALPKRALALARSFLGGNGEIVASCKRMLNAVEQDALAMAISREKFEIKRMAEMRSRGGGCRP